MRDTNQRDTPKLPRNRRLNLSVRDEVHTGRGLIQTNHFTRFHQRPRERQERPFAHREIQPLRVHGRIEREARARRRRGRRRQGFLLFRVASQFGYRYFFLRVVD
jgi:hypothetical protein